MKLRQVLKSKIHMARVTGTVLRYGGSVGIASDLLEASDMLPGERVQVLNFNNGKRLETYIIEEEAGSGTIALYGPAARCASPGDMVSIISYLFAEEEDIKTLKPLTVTLDEKNKIKGENNES